MEKAKFDFGNTKILIRNVEIYFSNKVNFSKYKN